MSEVAIEPKQNVTIYFCGKQLANNTPEKGNMDRAKNVFGEILNKVENSKKNALYAAMQNVR